MPKIVVPVTTKHLFEGEFRSAYRCALAKAINDCLKDGFLASVGAKDFWIYRNGKHIFQSRQERTITNFVNEFDNGFTLGETAIVLDIPAEFLKENL